MHTATLLHDDVVDESDMRRGKLAARMLWGIEASVLVGDFLLGQAFKMMVEVGNLHALEILSSAATVIAEGEVMQLGTAKNTATNEDKQKPARTKHNKPPNKKTTKNKTTQNNKTTTRSIMAVSRPSSARTSA